MFDCSNKLLHFVQHLMKQITHIIFQQSDIADDSIHIFESYLLIKLI